MTYDRRRWFVALIVTLLGVAVLVSALNMQVRADTTRSIADAPAAPIRGNSNANTSLRSSILGIPTVTTTSTRTPTRTPTATKTPLPPFNCSQLSLSNKRLFGNQFRIDIQNDSVFDAYITRVQLVWPNIPAYAQMGLAQMSLNGVAMWTGNDPQVGGYSTTTDTDTKQGSPPFSSTSISVRTVNALEANVYAATFNGPPLLSTYVSENLYAIVITIDSDSNLGAPCVLPSLDSPPTATPTLLGLPSPTVTPTPDCAPGLIAIHFNSYDNFGMVRFDILSQRSTTSTLTGFNINWQKYVLSQKLAKVSLVAPPGFTGAVVVWDSGNVNQDSSPPTNSQTEGTWLTNFTIPPGAVGSPSITPIVFDFEGIYRYDDYYDPQYGGASDFNFSEFDFTCDSSSGQPPMQITPEVIASPTFLPTSETRDTEMPPTTSTSTPPPMPTSTFSPMPTGTATSTPTVTLTPTMTLTPTATVTTTPEPLIINYFTSHTPTLMWTPVSWAVRYEIQISVDKDFAPAQTMIAIVPAKVLSYTTPFLSDGTFYWRVRALDANNNSSGWSKVDGFYIAPPPTAVTGN